MSFELNVSADIKEVTEYLTNLQRKQIPYAIKTAMNNLAFDVRKHLTDQIKSHIDRPVAYTMRAIKVEKYNPATGKARVYVAPDQIKYLRWQIYGGTKTKTDSGKTITVPGRGTRLNAYGNIPGRRAGIIKPGDFVQKIKKDKSIFYYKGRGRNKKLAARGVFKKSVHYKPRYPFHKLGVDMVRQKFRQYMEKALAHAINTAK